MSEALCCSSVYCINLVLLHLTRKLGHLIGMARRVALSIMLKNVFSVCICNVLSVLKCATLLLVVSVGLRMIICSTLEHNMLNYLKNYLKYFHYSLS